MCFKIKSKTLIMEYFYIHDIDSTTVQNKDIFRYCSKNNIDMRCIQEYIRNHITRYPDNLTEIVVIQCYECTYQGAVNQEEKYLITVIGQYYTHYVLDEITGTEKMQIASANEYNFQTKEFNERLFRKECFFSEQDSSKRVVELVTNKQKVYGNAHRFINEFCYDLYEKYNGINFKGRLLKKPSNLCEPFLMNESYVKGEFVIFGDAKMLSIVDDSHIKQYTYEHKTLCFDIETLQVDANGDKTENQIIQISMTYQEGKRLHRVIGITVESAETNPNFYDYQRMSQYFETCPESEIYCVQNENKLIEKFVEICIDVKPDYIAGYNVLGFDLQVLLMSAYRYQIDIQKLISHMTGFSANRSYIQNALKSSQKRKANTSVLDDIRQFQLSYKLFPGVLVNDLYRCHKGEKLDELAKAAFGFGKEDVSYVEIPKLFFSENIADRSKLLKYNIVDSLLCAALINTKDHFASYKFFSVSADTSKVPHSQFFNMQKTPMLMPLFYNRYKRKNMLQTMRIKPMYEHERLVITQVLMYFLYNNEEVTLPEASDLIAKFLSGEVKTKTIKKHMDLNKEFDCISNVDFDQALDILDKQFLNAKTKNIKHGTHFYTLTHLLLYIRFMTEPDRKDYDMKGLIDDYFKQKKIGRYADVNVARKRIKRSFTELLDEEQVLTNQFISFVQYVANRTITSSHTFDHILSNYFENELTARANQKSIEQFAAYLNGNDCGKLTPSFLEFLHMYKSSCQGKRFKDVYSDNTFCEEVYRRIGRNLLMEFDKPYKYDGAYIGLPNPGVEFEKPIDCLDFSSMYPCIAISYNMGPETIISQKTIVDNNLIENVDYVAVNIYLRDDHRKVDFNSLSPEEATGSYVFFLTTKHTRSTYCEVWEDALKNRLQFKRQIGSFDNERDNLLAEEKSNTYKICINSCYGILKNMGQWKISACVTSKGRQQIQMVSRYIEKHRNAEIVYGDTDSVMFHLNMTNKELCDQYASGELLKKNWIWRDDSKIIDIYEKDKYKQGCMISAMISKRVADEMNEMHSKSPNDAIYFPPSKLEHEKVMQPFVIFGQKHYFAKIMDTNKDNEYIIRGLEARKRNRLLATEKVENAMFEGLLQRNPSSFETFKLARSIVSNIISGTIELETISSRKKVTVTSNKLNQQKSDAGVKLFKKMKERGEISDTGGLDKISIDVIKVTNHEKKSSTKLESLDYLKDLQSRGQFLDLDNKAIVKQILNEVISVMAVIHPSETFKQFTDLLDLNISCETNECDFKNFIRPCKQTKKQIKMQSTQSKPKEDLINSTVNQFVDLSDAVNNFIRSCTQKKKQILKQSTHSKPKEKLINSTINQFFDISEASGNIQQSKKRKSTIAVAELKPITKKLKQMTLPFIQ